MIKSAVVFIKNNLEKWITKNNNWSYDFILSKTIQLHGSNSFLFFYRVSDFWRLYSLDLCSMFFFCCWRSYMSSVNFDLYWKISTWSWSSDDSNVLRIPIVGKIFIYLNLTESEKDYCKLNTTGNTNQIINKDNEKQLQKWRQQQCRTTVYRSFNF